MDSPMPFRKSLQPSPNTVLRQSQPKPFAIVNLHEPDCQFMPLRHHNVADDHRTTAKAAWSELILPSRLNRCLPVSPAFHSESKRIHLRHVDHLSIRHSSINPYETARG
jgi:hypothetical protein